LVKYGGSNGERGDILIDKNEETAFPVPIGQTGEDRCGMSLRDYFAGQALASLVEPDDVQYLHGKPTVLALVASVAYQLADAMEAERKKRKEAKQ
jgi:hypothetical protein